MHLPSTCAWISRTFCTEFWIFGKLYVLTLSCHKISTKVRVLQVCDIRLCVSASVIKLDPVCVCVTKFDKRNPDAQTLRVVDALRAVEI
jgi:hypothetical protein